jgi:hypothetical protein
MRVFGGQKHVIEMNKDGLRNLDQGIRPEDLTERELQLGVASQCMRRNNFVLKKKPLMVDRGLENGVDTFFTQNPQQHDQLWSSRVGAKTWHDHRRFWQTQTPESLVNNVADVRLIDEMMEPGDEQTLYEQKLEGNRGITGLLAGGANGGTTDAQRRWRVPYAPDLSLSAKGSFDVREKRCFSP